MTKFEKHVFNDPGLMGQVRIAADADPPEVLWRHRGRCDQIYMFLASRFLASPDGVLDCEGVHGQWKWIMDNKCSAKFKMVNAILKCSSELHINGGFPNENDIRPYIVQVRAALLRELAAVDPEISAGARTDWVHRQRFNMRLEDSGPLRARPHAAGVVPKEEHT